MVPRDIVLEVSGQMPAKKREQLYNQYRVIFGTPQTIENDIKSDKLEKNKIILLIFDQCHRSVGDASYAKIIRLMNDVSFGFRVIGLSATPGHEPERVQAVISNLNLVKIIYKDQKDSDVRRYLNEKIINAVEIKSNDVIAEIGDILNQFARPSINLLIRFNLITPWLVKNGIKSTSFFMIRQEFSQRIVNLQNQQKQIAYAALRIISFLIQSRKSLCERGFDTFKRIFFGSLASTLPKNQTNNQNAGFESQTMEESNFEEGTINSKVVNHSQFEFDELNSNPSFPCQNQNTRNNNEKTTVSAQNNKASKLPSKFQAKMLESVNYKRLYDIFFQRKGKRIHPKLQKLIEILQTFFRSNDGKVIIFTNFRVTAKQIQQYLSSIAEVKSQLFFGQSKTVFQQSQEQTSIIYLKQSQQLKIIERFKAGEINTLISTSIGEEGLDIGQVDCIVCYDGGHSPIRSIQRRGRTGRKRAGLVYFLLMEGKQYDDYRNGLKKQDKMKKMLTKQLHKFQYYSFNSTLFDEHSQIVVQHFDNQLSPPQQQEKVESGKQTKVKQKKLKKDQDGAETKKRKPRKQKQIVQEESNIEIKVTTIDNLLDKYHQNEEIQIGKQQSVEQLTITNDQQTELSHPNSTVSQQIALEKQSEQEGYQQKNTEILQEIKQEQGKQTDKFSSLSGDDRDISQNNDQDYLFEQYERYRSTKQANEPLTIEDIHEVSETDSISSDEFINIMDKLKQRKHFQKLVQSDDEPDC